QASSPGLTGKDAATACVEARRRGPTTCLRGCEPTVSRECHRVCDMCSTVRSRCGPRMRRTAYLQDAFEPSTAHRKGPAQGPFSLSQQQTSAELRQGSVLPLCSLEPR